MFHRSREEPFTVYIVWKSLCMFLLLLIFIEVLSVIPRALKILNTQSSFNSFNASHSSVFHQTTFLSSPNPTVSAQRDSSMDAPRTPLVRLKENRNPPPRDSSLPLSLMFHSPKLDQISELRLSHADPIFLGKSLVAQRCSEWHESQPVAARRGIFLRQPLAKIRCTTPSQ